MCTGIRLIAENGAVVYARTMEFGQDTESDILIIPHNCSFIATAPNNSQGIAWQSRYAVVGANMLHETCIVDGVNEQGLAGGLFYFPGYAEYQDITADQYAYTIAPWELMTFLLTQCATVADVKQALPTIKVAKVIFNQWGFVPPIHAIVHDALGNSLVMEYVHGQLVLYDNPLGVITNAPTFDWHLTNLQNYLNLSAINKDTVQVDGVTLSPFGQGSGMLGLPGDFTPPSRFVRAVAFSQTILHQNNANDTRNAAFHLMNLFDIPIGLVGEKKNQLIHYDYTQWTTVSDLHNKCYYWHTYSNNQVQMVDLMKLNLNNPTPIIIPMHTQASIIDVTPVL